jgi:hypothetical protein
MVEQWAILGSVKDSWVIFLHLQAHGWYFFLSQIVQTAVLLLVIDTQRRGRDTQYGFIDRYVLLKAAPC